jgi:hypothetical protein
LKGSNVELEPEELEEPEDEHENGVVIMGPAGPMAVPIPDGVHPLDAIKHAVQAQYDARAEQRPDPSPMHNPVRLPTMRTGPSSEGFSMKVIDCADQVDPASDPEVQVLLRHGWEPFGVHKFSSFTGAQGVRVYFKKTRPSMEN